MWALPAGGCLVLWARPSGDARLLPLLDDDARARHAALRREADRARSATAHVLTRLALGAVLGVAPGSLRFTRRCPHCGGSHGAPRLVGAALRFSVSHSGERVVVALADRPVGVDVEQVVGPVSASTGWTRAEAALKATGHGVAGLDDLVVTPAGEPPAVVAWTGPSAPGSAVHLRDLSPGDGHVGCVALLGGAPPQVVEHAADTLLASV